MKKTWKRNLIAAGVLLVVCAGIYLNWYAGHSAADLTETLDAGKILDDTTLVLQQEQGDALVTPVQQTGTQAEYFAQMRLSRQTARDEAVELLQETIAYADGDAASSAKLEGIISDALAESQIESLIVAKGYQDCVAYISEDGISVAVAAPEDGLTQSDVALLSDIVLSQTSCKLSDIRVIGVEPEKGQLGLSARLSAFDDPIFATPLLYFP